MNPRAAHPVNPPSMTPVAVTEREEWDRLFDQVPLPHFTQAWGYGEGKRAAQGWSVERIAFQGDERPVALCQVLVRRLLGLSVARINRGPLFMQRAPPAELQLGVLRALRCWRPLGRRGLLLIAPALPLGEPSTALLRAAGFMQRRSGGWGSALINLQPSLEGIRAALSSKWRNHLNASLKAGISLRVRRDHEAIDWMLERHASNMAAKGFAGPAVSFVRSMIASRPEDFWVLQALLESEPCSGILLARFGAHAETLLSWTGEAGRRANAHHFLLWHVLAEMKAAGCRALDLGGYTTTNAYGAYKRGMKGSEYRLAGEWLAI